MPDSFTKSLVTDHRDAQREFILAEYSSLRDEIKWIIGQIATLENTSLVFSGAVWAWVTANPATPANDVVVFLPTLLAVSFYFKRQVLSRSLREAADYVMRIERHFDLPSGLGWEHHLAAKAAAPFRWWRRLFWPMLIVVNITAATVWVQLNH